MQNKRGISQALSPAQSGMQVRPATVFDVFDLSHVLMGSITRMCAADHGDDPRKIGLWTKNKDPKSIREWITRGDSIWVTEHMGRVSAVGGLRSPSEVSLLYVSPGCSGQGVGTALLAQLEAELAASGQTCGHLHATRTALAFYQKNGWIHAGDPTDWNGMAQFPMCKSLNLPS